MAYSTIGADATTRRIPARPGSRVLPVDDAHTARRGDGVESAEYASGALSPRVDAIAHGDAVRLRRYELPPGHGLSAAGGPTISSNSTPTTCSARSDILGPGVPGNSRSPRRPEWELAPRPLCAKRRAAGHLGLIKVTLPSRRQSPETLVGVARGSIACRPPAPAGLSLVAAQLVPALLNGSLRVMSWPPVSTRLNTSNARHSNPLHN